MWELLQFALKWIFIKLLHTKLTALNKYIFQVAAEAINDTIGELGLAPSGLVFFIMQIFALLNTNIPCQANKMEVRYLAQVEV